MGIAKLNGIDVTTLSKLNGVDISTISKINGIELDLASYSTELQAVIDKAALEGFPAETSTVLSALNTLIASWKTNGFWAKQDYILLGAVTDYRWGLINIKSPSDTLATRFNSCTFNTLQGYQGDDISMYISTNYAPATNGVNFTLNDACIGCWIYSEATDGGFAVSDASANNRLYNASQNSHRINTGSNLNAAADLSGTGYKSINRVSSTNLELYNNTTKIDRTATSSVVSGSIIQLFKSTTSYSNSGISLLHLGAALTQTETNNLITDFQTYLTAITP